MTVEEFSNEFDLMAASYRRFKDYDSKESLDSIDFDEYEKSVFLTSAQKKLVLSLYNNSGFESTEYNRRVFDSLVRFDEIAVGSSVSANKFTGQNLQYYNISLDNSTLSDELMVITYEAVSFNDNDLVCYNGRTVSVTPVTQDELAKVIDNPFRGPSTSRVLRVDIGHHQIGLVSKYKLGTYHIGYLTNPAPIILAPLGDLTIDGVSTVQTCLLDESVHDSILEMAVSMAIQSKVPKSSEDNNNKD